MPSDVESSDVGDASLPSDVGSEEEVNIEESKRQKTPCKIDCECGDKVSKRQEGLEQKERLDILFAVMVERAASGKSTGKWMVCRYAGTFPLSTMAQLSGHWPTIIRVYRMAAHLGQRFILTKAPITHQAKRTS